MKMKRKMTEKMKKVMKKNRLLVTIAEVQSRLEDSNSTRKGNGSLIWKAGIVSLPAAKFCILLRGIIGVT